MLSEEILKETLHVDDIVQNELRIFNRINGREESFAQICRRFCKINDPIRIFYNGLKLQREHATKGEPLNERINLSYPTAYFYGQAVGLQVLQLISKR